MVSTSLETLCVQHVSVRDGVCDTTNPCEESRDTDILPIFLTIMVFRNAQNFCPIMLEVDYDYAQIIPYFPITFWLGSG